MYSFLNAVLVRVLSIRMQRRERIKRTIDHRVEARQISPWINKYADGDCPNRPGAGDQFALQKFAPAGARPLPYSLDATCTSAPNPFVQPRDNGVRSRC